MHNINNWLKRHFKALIAYTIGITLGITFACLDNGIRQDLTYQTVTTEISNNWFFISAIFAIMLAMIITGFFMGRKYEE